jgi:ABC-type transporter Mla maintaining outer membrane lipid asymmetry ATPase subunit MlaF
MTLGLELDRVSFRFGEMWIFRELSLSLPKGSTLVVTGENGVGKSTLLYLCAGLMPANSGHVYLAGHAPNPDRPSDLFRHGVRRGFVFYAGGLLSNATALGNVTLALRYHADVLGIEEGEIDRQARGWLSELRVTQSDFHSLPAHLSVGLRRRVSMARALSISPNFLFFDDPDANLDPSTKALVYDILASKRDDPEVTLLVTTSSAELIERLAVPPRELVHGHLIARS